MFWTLMMSGISSSREPIIIYKDAEQKYSLHDTLSGHIINLLSGEERRIETWTQHDAREIEEITQQGLIRKSWTIREDVATY
ncbi:Uncharacterized protein ACO02O_03178 [Dirofilaria immitis]